MFGYIEHAVKISYQYLASYIHVTQRAGLAAKIRTEIKIMASSTLIAIAITADTADSEISTGRSDRQTDRQTLFQVYLPCHAGCSRAT